MCVYVNVCERGEVCADGYRIIHSNAIKNHHNTHPHYLRRDMTILRQRPVSCVMGPSPEADLNKKSASHARSRLPGNNFFLLIGRSATPAPHAYGLACRSLSFSPASHWLLANDSSLPSCARAALYEYCMRSLAFLVLIIWIGASGEGGPRRVHEHTG